MRAVTTREVEVMTVGQTVAMLPKSEPVWLELRPRDRLSADLKVHFGEQNVVFQPNLGKKTFSFPLDRFFLGE